MCLLTAVFAAVITTAIWYKNSPDSKMNLGILCWMYWGASIMWLVDAVVEYIDIGAEYFRPAPSDMLNDLFLGLSVVALGLIIWIITLLIKDPQGVIKAKLFRK